jgi:hypothetical protein
MAPGAGLYEYCTGRPTLEGYAWPRMAVSSYGEIHVACLDSAGERLYYTKVSPWCTWMEPVALAPPQPDPGYPTHNIAASPVSDDVCVTWVYVNPSGENPGFYRISTDAGVSWGAPEELPRPVAYGGDTATSFHVSSLYPLHDDEDGLHIAAAVHPRVDSADLVMPAEIWHWCPDNSPMWSRVRRAGCAPENLGAPVGYNALYACRPSLGSDEAGSLFLAWEQFDSSNVEPGPPTRLRADIYVARSQDHGETWAEPSRLTARSTSSCRFPSMLGLTGGTLLLSALLDRVAGFYVLDEGPASDNPVLTLGVESCAVAVQTIIGGSTFDLQCFGPAKRAFANSPDYGLHAMWQYSALRNRAFPDRNTRYNFYDYATGTWSWIDPDFMYSGENVFVQRTGFGSAAADPSTGVAIAVGTTDLPVGTEGSGADHTNVPYSTIARNTFFLPAKVGMNLLDISGRKVMDLLPGENDVRHLSPGVYFVRQASSVYKVVIQR